jgi:hypothetical protein
MFKAVAKRLEAVSVPENQRLPIIVGRQVLEQIERLAIIAYKGEWKRGVWMRSPESVSVRTPNGSIEPITHCHNPIVAEFIVTVCSHASTLVRYVRHLETIREVVIEVERARVLYRDSDRPGEWSPQRDACLSAHNKLVALLDVDASLRASLREKAVEPVKDVLI